MLYIVVVFTSRINQTRQHSTDKGWPYLFKIFFKTKCMDAFQSVLSLNSIPFFPCTFGIVIPLLVSLNNLLLPLFQIVCHVSISTFIEILLFIYIYKLCLGI